MGILPSEQPYPSKKAPIDRSTTKSSQLQKTRRAGARQEGTLWRRKMHTLALRMPKGRTRRDRSGAPRKRG